MSSTKKVLHIFPIHSTWETVERLTIVVQPHGYELSDAYFTAKNQFGKPQTVERDSYFKAIWLPEIRSRFDDIIVHGNPIREFQCNACGKPRVALEDQNRQYSCDACKKVVSISELSERPRMTKEP